MIYGLTKKEIEETYRQAEGESESFGEFLLQKGISYNKKSTSLNQTLIYIVRR